MGRARGYFVFKFVDSVEEKQYNKEGKLSPRIRVFVKESFEWDFEKRPKEKQFIWTKSDEERYGNLTIIDLITSGGVIK